jgi:hypothetical protein
MASFLSMSIPSSRLDALVQQTPLVIPFDFTGLSNFTLTTSSPIGVLADYDPNTVANNTTTNITRSSGTGQLCLSDTQSFVLDVSQNVFTGAHGVNIASRRQGVSGASTWMRGVLGFSIVINRTAGTLTLTPTASAGSNPAGWHRVVNIFFEGR